SDTLHSWHATTKGFPPWFEPGAVVAHRHGGNIRSFLRERRVRGQDFARLRVAEEKRSRAWTGLHLLALPAIPFIELARLRPRAMVARWTRAFIATAPLQLAANIAWAIGDGQTHARILRRLGIAPESSANR